MSELREMSLLEFLWPRKTLTGKITPSQRTETMQLASRHRDAIGSCDLSLIDSTQARAETGFLFRRDQWGQGYAGEAMAALTAHAFGALGLELLTASTHAQNARARRVLERLGFGLERIVPDHTPMPGVRMDCALYALRRQASIAQKGA